MLHSCQRRPRPLHNSCFYLNSSHCRHFPFKVAANTMRIGGGELFQAALANTQQREPEKRVSLEIQSMIANPVFCSMLHILTTPGRTETFSSTLLEPQRTNQSFLHGQWPDKTHSLRLRKILCDMMQKKALVGLQITFKTSQNLKFYSPGHLLYFCPAFTPCPVAMTPRFYFGAYLFCIPCPCALWLLHDFQKQSMWLKLNRSVHSTLWWLGQGEQGPAWVTGVNEIHFCGFSGTVGEVESRLLSLLLWAWVDCILELQPGKGANRQKPRWRSGERHQVPMHVVQSLIPLCPILLLCLKGQSLSCCFCQVGWEVLLELQWLCKPFLLYLPPQPFPIWLSSISFFGALVSILGFSTQTPLEP